MRAIVPDSAPGHVVVARSNRQAKLQRDPWADRELAVLVACVPVLDERRDPLVVWDVRRLGH